MNRCLVGRSSHATVLVQLADDWRCGSAGRNAVVGVGSQARQVRSNKAKQARAVTQTAGGQCRLAFKLSVSTTSPLGPAVVMDVDSRRSSSCAGASRQADRKSAGRARWLTHTLSRERDKRRRGKR